MKNIGTIIVRHIITQDKLLFERPVVFIRSIDTQIKTAHSRGKWRFAVLCSNKKSENLVMVWYYTREITQNSWKEECLSHTVKTWVFYVYLAHYTLSSFV